MIWKGRLRKNYCRIELWISKLPENKIKYPISFKSKSVKLLSRKFLLNNLKIRT